MRKFGIVVLALFCSLLFSADRGGYVSDAAVVATTISIDHAATDTWLCERTYNSDLNLPRVLGDVNTSPIASLSPRSGASGFGQTAYRYAAAFYDADVVKKSSVFNLPNLSTGPHAVDYYVYSLRRLII